MKAEYLTESVKQPFDGKWKEFPPDDKYSYRVDPEQTVKFWIVVTSEEDKQKLIEESQYLHDELEDIDSDKSNHLMHIYLNPDMILVGEIGGDSDEENSKLKQ